MFIVYLHYGLNLTSVKVLSKSLNLSYCRRNVIESRIPAIESLVKFFSNILELIVSRIEHLSYNELPRLKRHYKSVNRMPEALCRSILEFIVHYFLFIFVIYNQEGVSSNLTCKQVLIALLINPLELILSWLLSHLFNIFKHLYELRIINFLLYTAKWLPHMPFFLYDSINLNERFI